MCIPNEKQTETQELANRFLRVLGSFFKAAQPRVPNNVVGQLHLNQIHTLHMLGHEPGLTQKEVAERLQVTQAAVSTAVRDMETLGLLQRQTDAADSRQMRLYLSESGQQLVIEAETSRCQAVAKLLSALPSEEQRMVVETLERALLAQQATSQTE